MQKRISRRSLLVALATAGIAAGCGRGGQADSVERPANANVPRPEGLGSTLSKVRPIPDRMELEAIELDTPVVELGWHPARNDDGAIFSEWDVADFAAGWHINSAAPGEKGNTVLSAHNNIKGAIFRQLDQVRKEHEVVLWSGTRRFAYSVSQVVIVPETEATPEQRVENARWIGPFDEERLTLVSCWPRNNNTHRVIVVAHRNPAAEIAHAGG
jgi:sortase A